MPPWLNKLIEQLLGAGAPIWAIVALACLGLLIWRGPAYLKVVLQYLNERRRILGDLQHKLAKLDKELKAKEQSSRRRRGKKADE